MFTYNFSVLVDGPLDSELTASMQLWKQNSVGAVSVLTESTQSLTAKMRNNYYNGTLTSFTEYSGPVSFSPDPTQNKTLLNGYRLYSYDGINPDPVSVETFLSDTVYLAYKVFGSFSGVLENDFNATVDADGNPINSFFIGTVWIKSGFSGNPGLPSIPKYSFISEPFTGPQPQTLTFNKNFQVQIDQLNYSVGDKIGFRFFIESNVGLVTASLSRTTNSILQVVPTNNSLLVTTSSVCVDQASNAFYLSPQLSPFFSNNYIFNPLDTLISSSYANLYLDYGDILYPFALQENDKIIVQVLDENGPFLEYTVNNIVYTGNPNGNGLVYIQIKEDISGYFGNFCNKFYRIIFLKRVNDETNIIINLIKPDGKTSYGFSIPQNIAPNVLENIDVITVNTKQQLIDAGINLTQ
jgi:hypothetical protein